MLGTHYFMLFYKSFCHFVTKDILYTFILQEEKADVGGAEVKEDVA